MRRLAWGLVLLVTACDARLHGPSSHATADGGTDDAGDAGPKDAVPDAPLGAWMPAQKIGAAGTPTLDEDDGTPSANTLELFFAISGANGKDLYTATRASATAAFGTAAKLSINSTQASDETPRLSADDLTLYFASARGASGTLDIYQSTRAAIGQPWTAPSPVNVNTTARSEKWFNPCGSAGYYVMIQDHAGTGTDLVDGTLGGAPAATIASLSSANNETGAFVTADCKTIYFASDRSGTFKLYTATRAAITDPWPAPTLMHDFDSIGGAQEDPWIAVDQRTFAFASNAGGTKDVYFSIR